MIRFAELMDQSVAAASSRAAATIASGSVASPSVASGWQAARGIDIRGVTADSRVVKPGDLFAAIPGGRQDGRRFIADAVARGAVAVLAPAGTEWPPGVPPRPLITDSEPRRRLAQFAATLAGRQPHCVIAVTGTNGKTSTVEFLRQLWALGGKAAASLGTLGLTAPGFAPGPGLTTPDPVALASILAAIAAAGVRHAAMEASSHGLDQYRLDGVRLAAAGFSNLTRDHLDYHGSFDRYRMAKLRLFGELLSPGAPAVVHSGLDGVTMAAVQAVARSRRLELHSVGPQGSAIRLVRAIPRAGGQTLELSVAGVTQTVDLPLAGLFQADNALLAAGLAMAVGESGVIGRLPGLVGVRGRLELVATLGNGAAVYVDYAHTPDALERLLGALRPHTAGRLQVVFGAGGDRDPGKRALMGAAAAKFADGVIVTDDNPRSELPSAIRAAIRGGCPEALEIGDRAAAIAAGVDGLREGDVLVVAGKGHEQGQIVGGTVIPFDDASVVRALVGA
jgi:UDP-N-acetylmuramoyl-L-alanyl-D-glutamate--2,6-diaminopimelate ligase